MPRPPDKAKKASACSSIVVIHSDIVRTFSSSPTVFPMMFSLDKAFRMIPKTWMPPKNSAVDIMETCPKAPTLLQTRANCGRSEDAK